LRAPPREHPTAEWVERVALAGGVVDLGRESSKRLDARGRPTKPGGAAVSVISDFRAFIARGNVVDLAVGVIIGAAFGKIVTSLVDQIIMPPIGLLLGQVDFSELKIVLKAADPAKKRAEVVLGYGVFINSVVQFLIIAASVFLIVRLVSAMQRKRDEAPAPPAPPTTSEALLMEIRDALRARQG
jgi:large conductance mechanosensitive channel